MTALGGAAGAREKWNPQPQPPQGLSIANARADGEAEQSLQCQWGGMSGGRAIMVVLPAAAESPRETEATYGPAQEEHRNELP